METINQRFTLSRVFTWVAMATMLVATIFKLLHLRGANEVFLISFIAMAGSLLSSSVSGIYFNRERKGAIRVMAIVSGVILMMAGYSFKLLHLPGADQILILAAVVSVISMLAHTIFVYNNATGNGNLFTFLHEKYTPGIERFLLIVLAMAVLSSLALKLVMLHIVVVYAAGLQLVALAVRNIEQRSEQRNIINLTAIILAITCLTIPMLGALVPFSIRIAAIVIFNISAIVLAFRMGSNDKPATYIAGLVTIMFIGVLIAKAGLMPFPIHNTILNLVVSAAMVVGIFLSQKNSVTRTYLVLSLSGYILETMIL